MNDRFSRLLSDPARAMTYLMIAVVILWAIDDLVVVSRFLYNIVEGRHRD